VVDVSDLKSHLESHKRAQVATSARGNNIMVVCSKTIKESVV